MTTRRCDVPKDVLERVRDHVASLAKDRKVEVIVDSDGSGPVVGHGSAHEFPGAVDQVVDRVAREQRKRHLEHQAPPLRERMVQD